MKPTAPGSLFIIFAFAIYFPLHLFSDLLNQKYKNTLLHFIFIYFIWRSIYQSITTFSHPCTISGAVTRKGLTTPLTRRVASGCYLCVVVVYVVLLGSPTGSITLVSYLREILNAAVLHHPFLFGENTDVASSDINPVVANLVVVVYYAPSI